MADTVQTLVDLFDALVGEKRDAFKEGTKIALLNGGRQAAWQVLVGWEPMQNWFVKRSQSEFSGQPDFFPTLDTVQREYALPPEFHSLRAIEPAIAGDNIFFTKANLDSDEFLAARRETASTGSLGRIFYDIEGGDPGTLVLASFPSIVLNVTLVYVAKPTRWTLLLHPIDQFPEGMHILIADWAAQRALLSARQTAWQAYRESWDRDVQRWAAAMRRDNTGEEIVRGFGE